MTNSNVQGPYVYQPHPISHDPPDRLWGIGGIDAEINGLTHDEAKAVCGEKSGE